MPMNNEERAEHASEGLAAYLCSKGEYDSNEPLQAFIEEYEISDLICDLLHLSDHLGYKTNEQIHRALMHYIPETGEAAGATAEDPSFQATGWTIEPGEYWFEHYISSPTWQHFARVLIACENETQAEGLANLRLIAAAPKLRDTLHNVILILGRISDAMRYEDNKPVTFLESDEIQRIYDDACSELAPIETLLREVRGKHNRTG